VNRLWIGLGSFLALIAIGAYLWLQQAAPPPQPVPVPVVPPPAIAPANPAINYPIQPPQEKTELPPIEKADDFVKERLTELLGAKTVTNGLQVDGFVRRVVATVDNLARPFAPPGRWPIHPAPGRFSIETGKDGNVVIADANAARYTPFVALVESVDSARAVALYQALYPLFQITYEGLGYPGQYFNDRLIAVIDLLLSTPEPSAALKVELPEISGPLQPKRPWALYRFSDPVLERLSSGQKMLLRAGSANEKRLKAKLAEFRRLIVAGKVDR